MISSPVKKIVVNLIREYANKIENGNSNITVEEAGDILSCICHIAMTKEEVCDFLNISRSRFDDLVREGKFPKGRKIKHKTNLIWYKDEILMANDS